MDDEVIEGGPADGGTGRAAGSTESSAAAVMPGDVCLPRRKPDTHKGDYGRVLIIGGSVGLTGAPVLSARAASRTGAGLVFVGVPSAVYDITAVKLDEEMPFPLPDTDGRIAGNAAGRILHRAKQCDVCLIGPGLGGNPNGGEPDDISELVASVMQLADTPLVIDAGGLGAISGKTDMLRQAHCPLILTPHPGEFMRLGGSLAAEHGTSPDRGCRVPCGKRRATHCERLRAATEFAMHYKCILVLKGYRTIIALPDGTSYVNTTGGPAMAKGGSGDVLAGMIAALVAQQAAGPLDIPMADAVVAAVYLHGLAGDMCAESLGEYSVTASDIISMIPKAMMTVVS